MRGGPCVLSISSEVLGDVRRLSCYRLLDLKLSKARLTLFLVLVDSRHESHDARQGIPSTPSHHLTAATQTHRTRFLRWQRAPNQPSPSMESREDDVHVPEATSAMGREKETDAFGWLQITASQTISKRLQSGYVFWDIRAWLFMCWDNPLFEKGSSHSQYLELGFILLRCTRPANLGLAALLTFSIVSDFYILSPNCSCYC